MDEVTDEVAMENDADVALAGMVTPAGTWATVVLLLESWTATPPAGAGEPMETTFAVEVRPAEILAGESVKLETWGGLTVSGALTDEPPPPKAVMVAFTGDATA